MGGHRYEAAERPRRGQEEHAQGVGKSGADEWDDRDPEDPEGNGNKNRDNIREHRLPPGETDSGLR